MTNWPNVKISHFNILTAAKEWSCVLHIDADYKKVLADRLALLTAFTANNTLESATRLINEAGVTCTEAEVDKVLFGERGMINSTRLSLEGNNPYRPTNYAPLTRLEGTPYFYDAEGNQYVRGLIVEGSYPYKTPTNTFTAIRNCIEQNLNLPRYIRHEVVSGDETTDRDENMNPR